jgi:hypothetical protein
MILGLCERFGCLPTALLAEDAAIMRWLQLEDLGGSREVAES